MKIMLVEDEAMSVLLMRHMLRQLGHDDIHEFASGEKALEALPQLRPDLVLMDINLAGALDGIETTIELKKYMDVPVIYVTGYDDKEIRQRAQQSGAAAFLAKPVDSGSLSEALSRVLTSP